MMIEETKAVIFDLDGTLVDSMWMWKDIDIEFLGSYGHDCPPELQKEIEGMSFSETAVYFKDRFGSERIHRRHQGRSGGRCPSKNTAMPRAVKSRRPGVPGAFKGQGHRGRYCHQQRKGDGGRGDGFPEDRRVF